MMHTPTPVTTSMRWRAMHQEDLVAVNQIAAVVHPDYPESPAVFAERLRLFARGCWIAADAQDVVHGYAISHPALLGQPPALNCLLQQLPAAPACLYLHDVALNEQARGYGLGSALLTLLRVQARQLSMAQLALTAVNGSTAYWQQLGFHEYQGADVSLAARITSYAAAARYLIMAVD